MWWSFLLAVGLIIAQTLVGVVFVAWLLPRTEVSFKIGLGLLIGILVAVMQQQAFIAVGARDAYIPVLLVSALGSTLQLSTRLKNSEFSAVSASLITKRRVSVALIHLSAVLWLLVPDWGWPLAFAALCLAMGSLLAAVRIETKVLWGLTIAITAVWSYWTIGRLMPQAWWFIDEDLYFYFGLGRGISQFGFWENPFIAGRPFNYHWLPYAWSGWISTYVDDPNLKLYSLLYTTVVAFGFVAMIRGVLGQLSTRTVNPYMVLAVSATTTLWITSRSQVPVSAASLGTTLGHLGSLAVFGLLLNRVRTGPGWRPTVALALASVFLVGSKIHSALPILAGLLVVLCFLAISERSGIQSVAQLALVISVIIFSFYLFYASQSSQGRLNFLITPRFDYVNTWGDMLETSQTSHIVWGLVVGMTFLIPSLTAAVVVFYSPVRRSDRDSRSILLFVIVSSATALFLAATIQQVSGTSFFFLSFAPTLGGVLIFQGSERTPHKRQLFVISVGVILIWALVNLPQVREALFALDWRLNRFRLFVLWNLVFITMILVPCVLFKVRRTANYVQSLPRWILVAAALSQLIVVHSLNYHGMATDVIPARSRQSSSLPPTKTEVALASWFNKETSSDVIIVSNNVDARLPALTGRRWFMSAPDFAKDGTEEGSRRGQLLASLLEAPSKTGLETLQIEGVDFFVFDSSLSDSTLGEFLEGVNVCYRDSRFEVVALARCP